MRRPFGRVSTIAHEALGFAIPVLDSRDVPDQAKDVLGWVFSHTITNDSLMEGIFLHYLFFGFHLPEITLRWWGAAL